MRAGQVIHLQPKAFDVLLYLLEHAGSLVGKQEVLDAVWKDTFVTENSLTVCIRQIRIALEDNADTPKYIETIPVSGYRFIAGVTTLDAIANQASERGRPSGPNTLSRRIGLAVLLAVIALAYFAYQKFYIDPVRDESLIVTGPPAKKEDTARWENSIAVLPFVNMSDDASNEYFSEGISEELLNLLTKIPELRVISRSSAFSFKGKDMKLTDVARELNVAHILDGSVRKADNQVRITAQLIEARSDTPLWSETYDRTLDDIFAIQDEIAGAVVDALKLTLLGDAPQVEQINPEAYALYLQAMYLSAQSNAEAIEQSNAMLKQVLVIAPDYARAWRGLARNYGNQVHIGLLSSDEGYALRREALNQALAIDPDFAEAHSNLALSSVNDGDLAAAAQHFEYALSLEPTNRIVIANSYNLILVLGRLDEAIAIDEYGVAHDPLNPIGHVNLAWSYLIAGRPDEAIASVRTALMLAPGYGTAQNIWGNALLLKGENEAALNAMQQEPLEIWRLAGLVQAYHALGKAAESNTTLTELIEKYERWAYRIAFLLAYRGEADRAFAWLEKAVQNNDKDLTYIAVQPQFANIHDDPRWLPFLESIGMSPKQLAAIEFKVRLPQ